MKNQELERMKEEYLKAQEEYVKAHPEIIAEATAEAMADDELMKIALMNGINYETPHTLEAPREFHSLKTKRSLGSSCTFGLPIPNERENIAKERCYAAAYNDTVIKKLLAAQ